MPSVAASAVPTSTGATAAGSVRGRAAISQMRAAVARAPLTAGAGTREVRACASPCRRRAPPAPPRCRRTGGWRRARAAGCRAKPSSCAWKLAFSSRSANGESASISRHHCDGLLLEPLERHDRVDEPHVERLLRVVLAAQEPDLLRLLRPDEARRAAPAPKPPSNEPTRGPVWPKRALSAAIVRSQTRCSTWPPPIA